MHDASTIASRRHRALLIVRAASLALGVMGLIALCYQIGLMLALQDFMAWQVMWGSTSWLAYAMAFLIPAAVLWWFDRRIVRWLVPVPRRECHECGYPLRGLAAATTRCPECGTAINATPSAESGVARP